MTPTALLLHSVTATPPKDAEGNLNYYLPGIEHPMHCVHKAETGKWSGSCDINLEDSTIVQPADWSPTSDVWNLVMFGIATGSAADGTVRMSSDGSAVPVPSIDGDWTCPEEHQSPSGCGDFRSDTRGIECTERITLSSGHENRIVHKEMKTFPQSHVPVARPIWYDNGNTNNNAGFGSTGVLPPCYGRHRESWPYPGEYEYLPPQRYLHGAEHGALVFLYDACLDEPDLCRLRTYIRKVRARIGAEFNFMLSPIKNPMRPLTIVTWGVTYMSSAFNEEDMNAFISTNYRQAWEEVPPTTNPGPYRYLLIDFDALADACPGPSFSSLVADAMPRVKVERGTASLSTVLLFMAVVVLALLFVGRRVIKWRSIGPGTQAAPQAALV